MATTADLYSLQKIDTTWEKVKRRLVQIRQQLGESEALTGARAQVSSAEAQLHHFRGQQQDAELEAQTLKRRIGETDARLMSGQVRNPKELGALQASLESLRRQQAAAEDRAVEMLDKVDEAARTLAQHEARLAEVEAAWRSAQGGLADEELKMKRNYVVLKKQREAMEQSLGAPVLEQYEQLRKKKGGLAVAAVEGDSCGACHVKLPTGVVSAARAAGWPPVRCPSCGRILFGG